MSKIKLLVFFTCYLLISLVNYSSSHEHNHHHDHDHHHEHENNHEPASFKYSKAANEKFQESQAASKGKNPPSNEPFETTQELWFYAIGSTLLISAAPFLILFLVPVDNTDSERPFLKILLAFASGGLLGDAFLHLIPQANSSVSSGEHSHDHATSHHGHSHSHSYDTSVGLWVLAGILAFFIVEKGVRIIKGSHSHSHKPKEVNKNDGKSNKTKNKSKEVKKVEKKSDVKIAGYLNLAADFSHNFTDGLAIGSSYLGGQTMGFVTTFLILLHEVPHEIGDFAILLQSGVPKRKAMLLQLVTAVGALSGTCISLFAQNAAEVGATSWILPFTAGGFIYIALVSVLPELLDEEKPSAFQTLLQLIALLAGLGMMVLITLFE